MHLMAKLEPGSDPDGPLEMWSHQAEANHATRRALRIFPRATVNSACGTGKTLMQLRLAADYDHVLIVEPSLLLIHQSLKEAQRDGLCNARNVVCVCSDPKVVRYDEPTITESELGVPVTTNVDQLHQIIASLGRRSLVYCTYHSLPILYQALKLRRIFGLIIFDEAHRTVGSKHRAFALALSDNYIPADHRVFYTATRRLIAPIRRGSRVASADELYSMDNEVFYGPVVFRLSTKDAIARKIICDYQIVVSCVTEEMVRRAMQQASHLALPQSMAPVEIIARQIASLRAMEETKAHRLITFHQRVDEALDFANDCLAIFSSAGVSAFHVNGKIPTDRRNAVIQQMCSTAGPAILTNARCLTEGVDIREVDMIGLMHRKESPQDLTQAAGRALRRAPGKSLGYMLLPLFIDSRAPSIVTSLKGSDLESTYNVLKLLLETDEDLAENISQFARQFPKTGNQVAVGRRKPTLRVLASSELLDALRRDISVRSIPTAITKSGWSHGIIAAMSFNKENGHLVVPEGHMQDDFDLHSWVQEQRLLRSKSKLAEERVRELEELGIAWHPREERQCSLLAMLKTFHIANGHFVVPRNKEFADLRGWIRQLRRRRAAGLRPSRFMNTLSALGFPWSYTEARFDKFVLQQRINTSNSPTMRVAFGGDKSAVFVEYVRVQHRLARAGRLPPQRAAQFAAAGIANDLLPTSNRLSRISLWRADFLNAKAYWRRHGSINGIPKEYWWRGTNLNSWLNQQRSAKRLGELTHRQIGLLDRLGIRWDRSECWERGYLASCAYARRHGSINGVSKLHIESGVRLHLWLRAQRRARSAGSLSKERESRLNILGIDWEPLESTWLQMLDRVKRFRALHFHQYFAAVKVDRDLSAWVRRQRVHLSQAKLCQKKIEQLNEIGFQWSEEDSIFEFYRIQFRMYSDELRSTGEECNAHLSEVHAYLNKLRCDYIKGLLIQERAAELRLLGLLEMN